MNVAIPKYFDTKKELLEFGNRFVQYVYDDCIDNYFVIYDLKTEARTNFGRGVKKIVHTFSEKQLEMVKVLTRKVSFYTAAIELDFLDRHTEYKVMIERDDGDRIALSENSNRLREDILGSNGLIDLMAKHKVDWETDSCPLNMQCQEGYAERVLEKDIPKYYTSRPALMKFGKESVQEIYDYAIDRWYAVLEGTEWNIYYQELIKVFSTEQIEALKSLIVSIVGDSFLRFTGLFESFDYWLVMSQAEEIIHISMTDPEDKDFERNELSFDMHDTEEDGIINLFSKYGIHELV